RRATLSSRAPASRSRFQPSATSQLTLRNEAIPGEGDPISLGLAREPRRGYARRMASLGELMKGAIVAVAPEDTLGEAAERMAEEDVGSAVVLDSGRLIGILTERDLLMAVAGRVHTSEARVRE